ncbi:MAG: hypothetical protein L6R40_001258 [Gallowayella cf. fulva]|nr:MAG: hypothetical protein L6R40_001258 [Xanthomendoza cf. fulva]
MQLSFPRASHVFCLGRERRPDLSPPASPKVATDIYDSDDAGPDRTPPLVPRIVNLKPSPSPDLIPSPAKSSSPDRMSRSPRQRKRRPKTQPSQGDAVLISFMGGLNRPDIATRAGEEPLNSASQSEAGEVGEDMDLEDGHATDNKDQMVQIAQNALSVKNKDDKSTVATAESVKRVRPKITTQVPASTSKDHDTRAGLRIQGLPGKRHQPSVVATENLDPALAGSTAGTALQQLSPPDAERRASSDAQGSSPLATSPRLRQFMASNGSETLPAIQSATPSLSAKSPNGQQSLPSISAQLGELVDGPSPNDNLPNRSSFPMPNGIQSPPMSGISSRPNHYPNPQSRLNSFPNPYPATQPSPASTFGEVSPREPFRASHDPTSMSPPSKPGPPYYTSGRIPQSGELTPQSAESHTGFKAFTTRIPPSGEIEPGRPILPPLPGTGPLVTGNFKCDYPACTAAPFQTQYLLNSHANVHSQVRPHYCPVKTCPRSEGGKGFKRKNEMIRHGLVHQSPGYVCPFCPEREHKYPRPDNLQRFSVPSPLTLVYRHVRVNHTDKDMNDPRLRDVLAQRSEGGTRGRRRRFGS